MTTYDLNIVCVTDLSDEVSDTSSQTARQDWLMVLCGPYEMVFAVVDSVRTASVELHGFYSTILKGSPEGEGFAPKGGYKKPPGGGHLRLTQSDSI